MSKTLAGARMPSLKDKILEEEDEKQAALVKAEEVAEVLEKVEVKEEKKRKDYKNKK